MFIYRADLSDGIQEPARPAQGRGRRTGVGLTVRASVSCKGEVAEGLEALGRRLVDDLDGGVGAVAWGEGEGEGRGR